MKYDLRLEIRPYPPIEIPRRELILPMPAAWFYAISGYDIEKMLMGIIYGGGGDVRDDFEGVFHGLGAYPIPPASGKSIVRVSVPIREDHLRNLEAAASLVGKSLHEVAIRILARQVEIYTDGEYEKALHAWEKEEAKRKEAKRSAQAMKSGAEIIPFPLEFTRC